MTEVSNRDTSDLVDTDAILDAELQKQAMLFMTEVANAFYQMDEASRVGVLTAIASVVSAMDQFPRELEPKVIYAPDTGWLICTFDGDPSRNPVVIELPSQ